MQAISARKKLEKEPAVHPEATVINSELGHWTEIGRQCSVDESVLGDYSYLVHHSSMIYTKVGKFCSIAAFCRVNPGNHPLEHAALHHFSYRSHQFDLGEDNEEFFNWRRSYPVTLGHDVWLGHGVTVLPGVTIGSGAAIGAGAVVSRDIEPFTVAAGVPARPIRQRFDDRVIADFLEMEWWHWPHKQIQHALLDFRCLSGKEFAEKYRHYSFNEPLSNEKV